MHVASHAADRAAARRRPGPSYAWLAVALALVAGLPAHPRADRAQAAQTPAPQTPPAQAGQTGQEAQQEQPVFRADITFVRVDVIVTDRQGNPVDDLTIEDFEVSEDGRPQVVETFKRIDVTGQPSGEGDDRARPIRTAYDEESEAQREDVRLFAIFLDDYHVRRGASLAVREPLIRFVEQQLGPLDMVAIMYPLQPLSDVRFTRNHRAIVEAIRQFDGRKYDYTPRNSIEEQYSMYPAEWVERIRNQVSLSALTALVTRLGGLREGRKSVILVSEGYTNYLPPQMRDPVANMPGIGNPNRRNPMAGERDSNEERYQFFQSVDLLRELQDVYAAANRNNTSIYALDPRGLAPFEFDINEGVGTGVDAKVLGDTMDTLRVLADQTDGRAIVNRNDLDGGLRQIIRDSSAYYLLGYNSSQAPADGKFHEIRVRVKRPGVQVRARKGYWALTAEEMTAALAPPAPGPDPAITEALASVEAPSRARVVRTWLGTEPAENGRTRVTFVWEPVPAVAGDRRPQASRVSLIAAGEREAFFRGRVPAEDAPVAGSAVASRGGGRAEFEAAPGRLQLRLSVEGANGEVIDSDLLDVTVPDFTGPQVRLSTLEVLRASTAREFQAVSRDPQAIPAAGREFRRTERLLIRFSALGPGSEAPETTARLLNRRGDPMSDLTVEAVAGDVADRWQVQLPLAGLPAGEYIVEVKSTAAGEEAKQLLGFRVVS